MTSNRDTLAAALREIADAAIGRDLVQPGAAFALGVLSELGHAGPGATVDDVAAVILAQARAEVVAAVEAVLPSAYEELRGVIATPSRIRVALAAVSGTDHDTTLDTVRAEAWEQGYGRGVTDAFTSMDFDGGATRPARVNPYRAVDATLAPYRADRIAPDDTPSEPGGDDAA